MNHANNDASVTDSALVFEPVDQLPSRKGTNYYTPQDRERIVRDVTALIEQGNSARTACDIAGISHSTFQVWISRSAHSDQYARAMIALAAAQVTHIDEITAKLEAKEIAPDAARVIIDARKWFASKFLPKQYGETRTVEHTGTITHAAGEMTEAQIRERLRALDAPQD